MDLHFECQLQLGAHAVNARNQDGIHIFRFVHSKQPAEAANFAEHAFGEGFMREVLDALLGTIGLVDVDARVGVGDGFGRILGHDPSV